MMPGRAPAFRWPRGRQNAGRTLSRASIPLKMAPSYGRIHVACRAPTAWQPMAVGLQSVDVRFLLANTAAADWAISSALRRSKSISDGVSIRGAGEIPSLRLSAAVEGVAEMRLPSLLEIRSVLVSEFIELFL